MGTDNVLIAYELVHALWYKRTGKEGFMAWKLYMSKVYDRGEWSFLEAIMRRMNFGDRWVSWIMCCVKSISYSILLNGFLGDYFRL